MGGERAGELRTRYSEDLFGKRGSLRVLARNYNKSHTLVGNDDYFIMVNNVRGGKKLVLNNRNTIITISLTGKADLIYIEQVDDDEFDIVNQYQEHLSYIQEILLERESLNKTFDSTVILVGIVDFLSTYISEEFIDD